MESLRKAACVILWRASAGPEIELFLVRRAETMTFLGGFHALPGGRVEDFDLAMPVNRPTPDREWRAGAVRELFEELGVLAAIGAHRLSADALADARRTLEADEHAWPDFLAANALLLDAGGLVPMGHWITPAYALTRFDAYYYALELPQGQAPTLWPGELTEGFWVTPSAALKRHQAGELFITYPVLETLRVLADAGRDLEQASQRMMARGLEAFQHAGGEMVAGVHVVPLRTPTLPPHTHTNTYVLGGEELVVVDPASPYEDEQAALIRYLEYLTRGGARVVEIWLTHHHHDHVGAVERVRQQFGVPVAAHARTVPDLPFKVDRLIEDGEERQLRLERDTYVRFRALHLPGHTQGHLGFYEPDRRFFLSGDLILGFGTVLVAPPEGNMQQYLASLTQLLEMPISMIFPAHGPPVAAAQRKVREYLAHRAARETAIALALQGAPADLSAEEIVAAVYTDIDPKAFPLAEMNVRAHLEKLVAEGRCLAHNGRFRTAAPPSEPK